MPLECKDPFQIFALSTVIQEPIIPDLLEAAWEYMHQITSDEFDVFESDHPARLTGFFTSGRKSDLLSIDRKDAAVRDGDLVGISSEISDRIARSIESLFDVRTPVLPVKSVFESFPSIRILQCCAGRRKNELFLLVQEVQERYIFPFELIPQDSDRNEESRGRSPDPVVRSEPSSGDDAVHMDMVVQFLVPGVEDLDDTRSGTKIFLVSRQFQESFSTAFMEQTVKKLLVTIDQGVQFMRKSEHHMEIGSINDFCPAFVHPDLFIHSLTVGAVTVTAGIIVDFDMAAIRTDADIAAQCAGLAPEDGHGGLFLDIGQVIDGREVLPSGLENLLDLTFCHRYLPSYQEGL